MPSLIKLNSNEFASLHFEGNKRIKFVVMHIHLNYSKLLLTNHEIDLAPANPARLVFLHLCQYSTFNHLVGAYLSMSQLGARIHEEPDEIQLF